ncbi:MAG: T9SS type A sorting domain-containing protein [Bacteroidetes bacterium]|nr:T9SS type A sorting domain-containing protein [Bacteroidota bacterium]
MKIYFSIILYDGHMLKTFFPFFFCFILFLVSGHFIYPQTTYDHFTGNLLVSVYDNGWIGNNPDATASGVIFEGNVMACFTAGIVYGDPIIGVIGMVGSGAKIQDMNNIVPFSFSSDSNFDQISTFQMSDLTFFNMRVTQTTFSNTGDDFIFIKYSFLNGSGNNYSDLYFGIFCDWNVGGINNFLLNRGEIDESRNLIYNWENGGAIDSSYYGIVAFNGLDGGTSTNQIPLTRLEGYDFLSVLTPPPSMDLNHRTIVGDGPYCLANGETLVVGFGIVAGNNLADLQANTVLAQSKWDSVIVGVEEQSENPISFILNQNYPNPFNPITTIKFSLPVTLSGAEGSLVTLKIYNALGEEVALLLDKELTTGTYEVEWNAGGFTSGVYFYQLKTEGFVETKKMLLLK